MPAAGRSSGKYPSLKPIGCVCACARMRAPVSLPGSADVHGSGVVNISGSEAKPTHSFQPE